MSKTININHIGRYKIGLIAEEIKDYIKLRNEKTALGNLFKKFCTIAEVTQAELETPLTVMTREDVVKIVDILLKEKK